MLDQHTGLTKGIQGQLCPWLWTVVAQTWFRSCLQCGDYEKIVKLHLCSQEVNQQSKETAMSITATESGACCFQRNWWKGEWSCVSLSWRKQLEVYLCVRVTCVPPATHASSTPLHFQNTMSPAFMWHGSLSPVYPCTGRQLKFQNLNS